MTADLTAALCVRCGERPRLGALTRCRECLREDAIRDREKKTPPGKTCKGCARTLPVTEFIWHSGNGRLHPRCKACNNRRLREYRRKHESVRVHDRKRNKAPHRRALARKLAKRWRANNPDGYRAQNALNNAVKAGKLKRQPCELCGRRRTHGHHTSYSKPLDVRWLCPRHHAQVHGLNPRAN